MKSKKKIYYSLAVFGGLSLLLIVSVIFPLFRKIKKNSEDFILAREKLILLQAEAKNLKEIETFWQTYQQDLAKIDNLFIDKKAPIEFIKFLENNAANSQLSIKISPTVITEKGANQKADSWPSLTFRVSTTGSFPNFLKFLEKLGNSPYLVEILNLDIKNLTGGELPEGITSGLVGADFSLKVFTQ